MTAIHFSAADFMEQFKKTKTKEEEALALVRAFEHMQEDNKRTITEEVNNKDLATKADINLLRQELTHYATKKELVETVNHAVNTGKWQVIGAVAAMLFAEIALRHLGF